MRAEALFGLSITAFPALAELEGCLQDLGVVPRPMGTDALIPPVDHCPCVACYWCFLENETNTKSAHWIRIQSAARSQAVPPCTPPPGSCFAAYPPPPLPSVGLPPYEVYAEWKAAVGKLSAMQWVDVQPTQTPDTLICDVTPEPSLGIVDPTGCSHGSGIPRGFWDGVRGPGGDGLARTAEVFQQRLKRLDPKYRALAATPLLPRGMPPGI